MVEILNFSFTLPISVTLSQPSIFIEMGNEDLQVINRHRYPLLKYNIAKKNIKHDVLQCILNFYNLHKGAFEPLLYQDPIDFDVTSIPYDTGLGIYTQGVAVLYDEVNFKYQLCKKYFTDNQWCLRPITRIVNSQNFVLDNSTPFSIDFNTGIVSFQKVDPGSVEITWTGEFATLCRFDSDTLSTINRVAQWGEQGENVVNIFSNLDKSFLPENHRVDDLVSIGFTEIKELTPLETPDNVSEHFLEEFLLRDDIDRETSLDYRTQIDEFASRFEKRLSLWDRNRRSWQLGERNINYQDEMMYLIGFWRLTRGGATGFRYNDTVAHFTEELNYEIEFNHTRVNTIKLVEKTENTIRLQLDNQTYIHTVIDTSGNLSQAEINAFSLAWSNIKTWAHINVFDSISAESNKYIKDPVNEIDKSWLKWITTDVRDFDTEPKKIVYLIFTNSADTVYHSSDNLSLPLPAYDVDLKIFLMQYNTYQRYQAFLFSISNSDFETHLDYAINGGENYLNPLKQYPIRAITGINSNVDNTYYVNVLQGLDNIFDRAYLPIANCYLITRNDGVKHGFTDHDGIVTIGDDSYFPYHGGNLESISTSYEPNVNTTTNTHVFNDDGITIEDINAGAFNKAKYEIFIVNWQDPTQYQRIFTGFIGKFNVQYYRTIPFRVVFEIRSVMSKLKQKISKLTLNLCPLRFGSTGDNQCNADMVPHIDYLNVVSVVNNKTIVTDSVQTDDNYYGQIEFTTGTNLGWKTFAAMFDGTTKTITFFANTPRDISVGDTIAATRRCEKTDTFCINEANNAINYQGFPNIPGNDALQKSNRGI